MGEGSLNKAATLHRDLFTPLHHVTLHHEGFEMVKVLHHVTLSFYHVTLSLHHHAISHKVSLHHADKLHSGPQTCWDLGPGPPACWLPGWWGPGTPLRLSQQACSVCSPAGATSRGLGLKTFRFPGFGIIITLISPLKTFALSETPLAVPSWHSCKASKRCSQSTRTAGRHLHWWAAGPPKRKKNTPWRWPPCWW